MVKIGAAFAFPLRLAASFDAADIFLADLLTMTAFPISDFAKDAGADFGRDFNASAANARAKTKTDDVRDIDSGAHDKEVTNNAFERALRDNADVKDASTKRSERGADRQAIADKRDAPKTTEPEQRPNQATHKSAQKAEAGAGQSQGGQDDAAYPGGVETASAIGSQTPASGKKADANPGETPILDAQLAGTEDDAAQCALPQIPLASQQPVIVAVVAAPQIQNGQSGSQQPAEPQAHGPSALAGPLAGQSAAAPALGGPPGSPDPLTARASASAGEPTLIGAPGPKRVGPGAERVDAANAKSPDTGSLQSAASSPNSSRGQVTPNLSAALSGLSANDAGVPTQGAAAEKKAADAAQAPVFTQPGDAPRGVVQNSASAPAIAHTSANTNAVAQNVVRFFKQTGSGSARFEIRLDPVELGRVDARVEVNSDKSVSLTLSAERPETLAELMRSARDLERQLSDSGVRLSEDGLKFRLNSDARGNPQQNMQNGEAAEPRRARGIYGGSEPVINVDAVAPIKTWRASGVDVWA